MNTLSQYIYFSSAEEQAQCNQCMQECCQLETAALCEKMSVKSFIAISAFGHRIVPLCSYSSMFYNLVTFTSLLLFTQYVQVEQPLVQVPCEF